MLFMLVSAGIILALGVAHLVYTFYGKKLTPRDPALLFQSTFLPVVGFAMLGGLMALGKLYWFSVPFRGICLSFAFYAVAMVLARM